MEMILLFTYGIYQMAKFVVWFFKPTYRVWMRSRHEHR